MVVAPGCAPFEDVPTTRCSAAYQSSNGDEIGVNATGLPGDEIAQSFKATFDAVINAVELPLRRVGTLAGVSVTLRLVVDSGGAPATTDLATSTFSIASSSSLSTAFQVVTFALSSPVALTQGESYWIRLKGVYGQSSVNYVAWRSNSMGGYGDGAAFYNTSAGGNTFSNALLNSRDALFRMGCEEVEE